MNKYFIIFIFLFSVTSAQAMWKTFAQSTTDKADDRVNKCPLNEAIYQEALGDLEILLSLPEIKSMINRGDAEDIGQPAALHVACIMGSVGSVKLLLNAGADIEVRTTYEETPLNFLMNQFNGSSTGVVEVLLDYGADVNTVDRKGQTPLHGACKAESTYMVDLLLIHGAVEQPDKAGKLPREYASNNSGIQRLFMSPIVRSKCIKIPERKAGNALY